MWQDRRVIIESGVGLIDANASVALVIEVMLGKFLKGSWRKHCHDVLMVGVEEKRHEVVWHIGLMLLFINDADCYLEEL